MAVIIKGVVFAIVQQDREKISRSEFKSQQNARSGNKARPRMCREASCSHLRTQHASLLLHKWRRRSILHKIGRPRAGRDTRSGLRVDEACDGRTLTGRAVTCPDKPDKIGMGL
jgi:hypothetical protein